MPKCISSLKILIPLLVALILGTASLPVTEAFGEQPALGRAKQLIQDEASGDCNGLDLVVLYDQSFSMKENDTAGLRAEAIRTVINILGSNVLFLCPEATHRLIVIGFWEAVEDSGYQVYIPPTTLSPDPEQWETEWVPERERLKSLVQAETRGNTDYLLAFQQAAAQLAQWRNEPLNEALPRKQGVILMADGGPCKVTEGCHSDPDQSTFNPYAYMERVVEFANPSGSNFPYDSASNSGVSIWMIAFQDSIGARKYTQDERLMGPWRQITQSHGGDVLILGSATSSQAANADITSKLVDSLNPLLGSELFKNRCGEDIPVDPYADNLVVYVFKLGSSNGIPVEDVTLTLKHVESDLSFGTGLPEVNAAGKLLDHPVDGPNESFVIANPSPGYWRVDTGGNAECKDLDVRFIPTAIQHKVLAPSPNQVLPQLPEAPFYDEDAPILFTYEVTEGTNTNVPVREISGYPLTLLLTVKAPSGDVVTWASGESTCKLERQVDNRFQCPWPILTESSGSYAWALTATTPSFRPNEVEHIVFTDEGQFNVGEVDRFGFVITEPITETEYPVNRIDGNQSLAIPMSLHVQLVDDAGAPLDPRIVVATTDQPVFNVKVLNEKGDVILEERTISTAHYDPQSGTFTIPLRENNSAPPDAAGNYRVQVSLTDNIRQNQYYPRFREVERTVARPAVTPVDFQPVIIGATSNAEQPLYKGRPACVGAEVVPIRSAVTLVNPDDPNQALDPAILTDGEVSKLFTASLVPPGDGEEITLEMSVEQSGREGSRLVTVAGEEITELGSYLIRYRPNPDALKERYQWWRTEATEVSVTRYSSLSSEPRTCQGLYGLAGLIGFAILGVITYFMVGGPTGSLVLIDPFNSDSVLTSMSLGTMPRIHRKRSSALKSYGVQELRVERAEPLDPDSKRAVRVVAKDTNGAEFWDGVLEPDQPIPFVEGADIVYR